MDNKNVFVAIALSMSVLLFWGAFFETPTWQIAVSFAVKGSFFKLNNNACIFAYDFHLLRLPCFHRIRNKAKRILSGVSSQLISDGMISISSYWGRYFKRLFDPDNTSSYKFSATTDGSELFSSLNEYDYRDDIRIYFHLSSLLEYPHAWWSVSEDISISRIRFAWWF